MRFQIAATFVAIAAQIAAQTASNPISFPLSGDTIQAGEETTITWTPTTGGTVRLQLRSGPSEDLIERAVIVDETENTGSYEWTPDKDITRGSDYADEGSVNYSPQFSIDSDNTTPTNTEERITVTATISRRASSLAAAVTTTASSTAASSSRAPTTAPTQTSTPVSSASPSLSSALASPQATLGDGNAAALAGLPRLPMLAAVAGALGLAAVL